MMQRLAEFLGLRRPPPLEAAPPLPEDAAPPTPLEAAPPLPEAVADAQPTLPVGGDGVEADDALAISDPFREAVTEALRTVYDPEIPTNIFELGLIYGVKVDLEKNVQLEMTLTAPGCPVAGEMPGWVHDAVAGVEGAGRVEVELVWDPPWDPSRMSEIARLETGFEY
jgi:FeS assembly SUF system protein